MAMSHNRVSSQPQGTELTPLGDREVTNLWRSPGKKPDLNIQEEQYSDETELVLMETKSELVSNEQLNAFR